MATSTGMHDIHDERSERTLTGVEAASSLTESIAGIAVVVLAILALTGIMPVLFVAICTIIAGGALMFQGGSIAAMYTHALTRGRGGIESGGGAVGAEFIGGAAGIVLGILALLNVAPMVLITSAVIVYGAALLLSAGVMTSAGNVRGYGTGEYDTNQVVAYESIRAAAGSQMFVGLAAMVLGILAILGIQPVTLSLIALLAIGVSVMLTGSALSGRSLMFRRRHYARHEGTHDRV